MSPISIDVGTAIGYLDLDTSGFQRGFKSALQDLRVFQDESATAGDKFKAVGGALSSVGGSLTKGVTLPLVGIGTAAATVGIKFESAMSRVGAIAGATEEDMKSLNDQALQLGADTAFSAQEAAGGMENLASAGFSVNEIMDAMPGLLDLAASSGASVADASEIAASAIRGFGLEAKDAGHVADVFALAAAKTNAQTEDMGEAMKYVAPVAKAMGQSIEETAAAIGIMSDAGIKGSQAGTALRGAMSRLAKPTDAMYQVMTDLGLAFYDAEGKMLPLNGIVSTLETGMKDLTQEQRNNALVTLFGQESLSGILALMERGPETLVDLTKSFEDADGAAADMATTMLDNTGGSIDQMLGSIETLGIKISQVLAPVIRDVVDKITEFVNKLASLDEGTLQTIVKVAGFAAALGPVLLILGKVSKGIGGVMNAFGSIKTGIAGMQTALAAAGTSLSAVALPIVAIVAVVATLVAAFKHLWDTNEEFKNSVIAIWERIKGAFDEFTQGIIDTLNGLGFEFDNITQVIGAVWDGFCQLLAPVFEYAFETIANVLETILGVLGGLFDVFAGIFSGDWDLFWEGIKKVFESIWNGIKTAFENIWNAIKGVVDTVLKLFGTSWDEFWTGIKTFFENIWNNIKQFFSDTINNIKTSVTEFIDNVVKFFTELPGKMMEALTNALNNIKEWGSNIIEWAKVEIPKVIDNIMKFFLELPGKMLEIGGNLLKGLWDGILGAVDWVKDKISGIGDSILGWFKDAFGIHSPSRETAEMGDMLMQGLAGGMDKNMNVVMQSVMQLTDMLTTRMEALVSQIAGLMEMANSRLQPFGVGGEDDQKTMAIYADQVTDLTMRHQAQFAIVQALNNAYNMAMSLFAAMPEVTELVNAAIQSQVNQYHELTQSIQETISALRQLQAMQNATMASAVRSAGVLAQSNAILERKTSIDAGGPINAPTSTQGGSNGTSTGTFSGAQFIFNSPKAVVPTEAARLLKKTAQQIAIEI